MIKLSQRIISGEVKTTVIKDGQDINSSHSSIYRITDEQARHLARTADPNEQVIRVHECDQVPVTAEEYRKVRREIGL